MVQQCGGLVRAPRPGTGSALTVLPAGTAEERAADTAADALFAGRPVAFGRRDRGPGSGPGATGGRCCSGTWRGSTRCSATLTRAGPGGGRGDAGPVAGYRDLLAELGRAPRQADEARLRAAHPGLDPVRLPGSGLVVTLGELNVLPDYLGRPEDIESAPLAFLGPLIQSVRSWSIAELARPAGLRGALGPLPAALPRLLPGSLRYPLLGPLAETAEIAAVSALGRRHGFAPANRYAAVLARNSGHFAPFSWYRWHSFHQAARALIARSADRDRRRTGGPAAAGADLGGLRRPFPAGLLRRRAPRQQDAGDPVVHRVAGRVGRLLSRPGRARHADGGPAAAAARPRALRPGRRPGPRAGGDRWAGAGPGRAGRGRRGHAGGADRGQRRGRRLRRRAARRLRGLPGDARQRHRAAGGEGRPRVPQCALARRLGRAVPARASGSTATTRCWPARPGRCGRRRRPPRPAGRSRSCCPTARPSVDSWDIFDRFPDHVEHDGRLVSLPQWHREGLRDLCFELFGRRSTRALRSLMSGAFGQRVLPTSDALK